MPIHPNPKIIGVYDATAFGAIVNPTGIPYFEYSPSGPIDFMRARMNRTWFKTYGFSSTYLNWQEDPPIQLVENETAMRVLEPPYEPAISSPTPQSPLRKKERATIQVNDVKLNGCGNTPATPSLSAEDKWLFVLESDRTATAGSPVSGIGITDHGIISTFSKLQENGSDNASPPIEFYDHVFDYEAPLDKKEVGDNYYGSVTVSEANIKPVYNFYVQPYETILTKFTGSDSPPESILPSLYSFLSIVQNTDAATKGVQRSETTGLRIDASIDTIFEQHATLNGLIEESRIETEVVYNRGQAETTTAVSKGQYFDKFAYAFAEEVKKDPAQRSWNIARGGSVESLADRFKNQIAPAANLDLFTTFEDVVNRFPMYCDISFSTDSTNTELLQVLGNTKLTTMLIKDFVDGRFAQKTAMDFNFINSSGLPFKPTNYEEVPFSTPGDSPAQNIASGTLDCWDVTDWLATLGTRSTGVYAQVENGVYLGNFDHEIELAVNPITTINRALNVTAFSGKLNQMVDQKTRDWKDMVGGVFADQQDPTGVISQPKKAYHETIFYKMEKWEAGIDGEPIGTAPIQNFYFPNSVAVQEHKFIDTQVKYGKKYIYRIYAFEMVFGTKYFYTRDAAPVQASSINLAGNYRSPATGLNLKTNQARICIFTEPSIRLVKIPYYQKEVIMMDSPPVMPDVEIVPYQGVKDKLVFWLRGNTGNYKLNPVIIQPGDQEIIDNLRLAQEINNKELMLFKSDDHPSFFEVFRLETKPARYEDFIGSKIAHIATNTNMDHVCKSSTTGEWIDNITPNQKYYYIFRTIDNHGHFSNPSPVYELEMVYDGYAPFLLRSVYSLDDNINSPQVPAKSFSKYIYIKPAYAQKLLNKEKSGLVDSEGNPFCDTGDCLTQKGLSGDWIKLGTSEQTLWKKAMKVRIISKKTGKRIDINIKYKHEPVRVVTENNRNNNLC